ncbi:hypothetical protein Q4509_05400 [Oceanihabitans sp. 1_MG-2023]|nr:MULTISPECIES: hypothetical protein [Flavobacteriaceae]MDO6622289.1 hypothetical protein [Oceanihabitans sp. 1_MG-2023]
MRSYFKNTLTILSLKTILVYGLLRDQVTKLVNKNRIESPLGLM